MEMSDWNPLVYQCRECGACIWSASPRQYSQCPCGESFVDQSLEYVRAGGAARYVCDLSEMSTEGEENKKKKEEESDMTYSDLVRKLEKMGRKLPRPPYHHHFRLSLTGDFEIVDNTILAPEEAYRLGKWLVDFYGSEFATTVTDEEE